MGYHVTGRTNTEIVQGARKPTGLTGVQLQLDEAEAWPVHLPVYNLWIFELLYQHFFKMVVKTESYTHVYNPAAAEVAQRTRLQISRAARPAQMLRHQHTVI